MPKPEWGVKRTCPTCGARFYDLTRSPAHCPKCGAEFDPQNTARPKRVKPEKAEPAAAAAASGGQQAEVLVDDGDAIEDDDANLEPAAGTGDADSTIESGASAEDDDLGDFAPEEPLLEEDPDDGIDDIADVARDEDDTAG